MELNALEEEMTRNLRSLGKKLRTLNASNGEEADLPSKQTHKYKRLCTPFFGSPWIPSAMQISRTTWRVNWTIVPKEEIQTQGQRFYLLASLFTTLQSYSHVDDVI